MKKEIVINASKDRSRIAIVEDGELVELYVEHPDNVRTLGNIYLARIRKIMPGIRAAFVDIGQKQDAFLHFSDLTDNLPALLALAGEKIPGVEALPLSHAPQKRVADDESEPAIEEKLDFDTPDGEGDKEEASPNRNRRSRSGRSNRRSRGGRRRSGRREEEEEQEEAGEGRRSSPFVIDLTLKTGKVEPQPAGRRRAPSKPEADASEAEPKAEPKEKPARRTARRKADVPPQEGPDADAPPAEPAETPVSSGDGATEAADAPASRGRRTTRKAAPRPDAAPEAKPEAPAEPSPDDAEPAASKTAPTQGDDAQDGEEDEGAGRSSEGRRRRGRRGRRGGRRRRGRRSDDAQTQDETKTGEAGESKPEGESRQDDVAAEPQAQTERSSRGRGRRAAGPAEDSAQADAEAEAATADTKNEAAEKPSRPSSERGRRRASEEAPSSRRGRTAEPSEKTGDAAEKPGRTRSRGDRSASKPEPARQTAKPSVAEALAAAVTDRPEDFLRRDGVIPVKITKEPISAKGSRVSTDISLAGRFLVLVPAADYVAVSKKIESARERRRLKTLAASLKPEGCGVIVRTVAEGRDAKTLDTDLRLLVDKWRKIEAQIRAKPTPPVLLYEDVNMVSSIIRDLFTEDYDRILIDDPKLHKNVKAYVQAVAPHMAEKVVLHRSNTPIFRAVGIEKAVEQVFSARVPLPSGGYLFIEHTEAMHVIDVNSGRAGRGKSQAENLLAVNLEAAREVAKQLRLRDLGGIIVVDFIDMRSEADRRKVYNELKTEFKKDRAVTKLLPMSDFGLVEITRQRLRPSITAQATVAEEAAERLDPQAAMAAAGATEIPQPNRDFGPVTLDEPVTTDDVVERLGAWLKRYREEVPEKYRDRPIVVQVHPLLASHLRRGFPSLLTRLRFRHRPLRFHLDTEPTLHPLDFEVQDEKSGKPLKSQYAPST